MKRLVAVISGLLILPAFAEVAPLYYDAAETEYIDDADVADVADDMLNSDVADESAPAIVSSNAATPRTTRAISRVVPTGTASATQKSNTSRRTSATRGVTSRVTARTAATRANIASRPAATNGTTARTSSRTTNNGTVSTRNTPASSGTRARASIVQTDTVNTSLYNGTAGRVGLRTNVGVASRVPTIRAATAVATPATTTVVNAADTAATMNELAELTDYCKAQYTECMDNFCNVLDDNQGRCSCSKNLKNYEKTETALKDATAALQDVAAQIQYIGLSSSEVETLFAQTEAELKMSNSTDNSKIKNDLDKIKNMIVNVKSGTTGVSDANTLGIDLSGLLDFNISSTGFDLSSLFGGTSSNTSSITNQRGETLYKTATARCKASVLNTCATQGVDISIVSNAYDMEIDKQCIAYERSLTDANDQMSATVRNAKTVLQKARLLVAQNKNQYDMRGCINALDACMQDDYVCGSDYENCLDPTGKYIVNGAVVKGSLPGIPGGEYGTAGTNGGVSSNGGVAIIKNGVGFTNSGLYATWDYDNTSKNAWSNGNLADYITSTISKTANSITTPANMTEYLKSKIGYVDKDNKVQGMCASVLTKCQDYTYTGTGNSRKYNDSNDVIKNYLERVMVQIKAKQDDVISDYAEGCISDVSSCLAQNNYNYYYSATTYSTLTNSNPSNIAIQACMSIINTCKSATTPSSDASTVYQWLDSALGTTLDTIKAACTAASDSNGIYFQGTWSDGECKCKTGGTYYDAASFRCVNNCMYSPQYPKNVTLGNGDRKCGECPAGETPTKSGSGTPTQYECKAS
ncbi:MAG: hypothetical protein IJ560_00490 [Alphaproteobacteria bacterium]|nr:hypothetical protein [Alphaproteobacteria bacterium]